MQASQEKSLHKASSISKSFVVRAFSRDKDQKSSKSRTSKIKAVKNVTLHPDIDRERPVTVSDDEAEQLKVSVPAVPSKRQDDTNELARDAGGKYMSVKLELRVYSVLFLADQLAIQIFSSYAFWRAESFGYKRILQH